jgi:hypothetical protein
VHDASMTGTVWQLPVEVAKTHYNWYTPCLTFDNSKGNMHQPRFPKVAPVTAVTEIQIIERRIFFNLHGLQFVFFWSNHELYTLKYEKI